MPSYCNNKPKQLKNLRKASYNKLYSRQPQLMEKLIPFLNHAELIAQHQEKLGISPFNIQKIRKEKAKLIKKLNEQSFKEKFLKPTKTKKFKKVSEVPSEILWSLR